MYLIVTSTDSYSCIMHIHYFPEVNCSWYTPFQKNGIFRLQRQDITIIPGTNGVKGHIEIDTKLIKVKGYMKYRIQGKEEGFQLGMWSNCVREKNGGSEIGYLYIKTSSLQYPNVLMYIYISRTSNIQSYESLQSYQQN